VRILVWHALVFVLGMIVVFLIGAAVGHYVWSDMGTLEAELAAARQQVAAAQQETAAARQQAAAAGQQAVVMRTQVNALQAQYAFVTARDDLDRLDRMRNALSATAHKSGAKQCLRHTERWLTRARRPADALYQARNWTGAATAHNNVIVQLDGRLQSCDPAVRNKVTIRPPRVG
jgi:outer membrane PBP1 activator LpoA protein